MLHLPTTACRSLENDLIIKNDKKYYIGGNQGWFLSLGYKDIEEYGCGIIAICNLLMCLWKSIYKSKNTVSKDTFTAFALMIYKKYLNILDTPIIKGLTGFALARAVNAYFKDNRLPMKARWGFGYNILLKVNKSLQEGMPVILGVGPDLLSIFKKKKGIEVTDIQTGNTAKIYAHYVLIYDCKKENGESFFYISSWGRGYKLSYSDFIRYQKKTFLGFLLSNILEIHNI